MHHHTKRPSLDGAYRQGPGTPGRRGREEPCEPSGLLRFLALSFVVWTAGCGTTTARTYDYPYAAVARVVPEAFFMSSVDCDEVRRVGSGFVVFSAYNKKSRYPVRVDLRSLSASKTEAKIYSPRPGYDLRIARLIEELARERAETKSSGSAGGRYR